MEPYMDPRFSKKETGQMQQNGFYRDTVCDPEIKKQENWEKEDFSAPSSFLPFSPAGQDPLNGKASGR